MTIKQTKEKTKELLIEFFGDETTDSRGQEILDEVVTLVPDPQFLNYIFQTDDYWRNNDTLDYDAVIEKGFSFASKSSAIAL